jgi:hypothetical protein
MSAAGSRACQVEVTTSQYSRWRAMTSSEPLQALSIRHRQSVGSAKRTHAGRRSRWSITKASKSQTRQIQASEASDEPKHHDNDQEQTKNAPKPGASVAVMSVVPSAAKEKNQDKDDKNRAHDSVSRQFLIARPCGEAATTSDNRRGCAEGRALC